MVASPVKGQEGAMRMMDRCTVVFKMISAAVAGIFLFNQIAWAGDLINTALEQQYKD